VAQLITNHDKQSWFVDYANELDWMSVYGEPERRATIADAIEYYEKRQEIAKASEALLVGARRGVIKTTVEPDDYTTRRVGEKLLEAYFPGEVVRTQRQFHGQHPACSLGRAAEISLHRVFLPRNV
jgi:hypothetical protein